MMDFQLPEYNLQVMLPEIFLFVWALLVIGYDLLSSRKSSQIVGYLALAGPVVALILLFAVGYGRGFGSMFVNDPLSVFFKVIFLGAAFMAIGSCFGITKEKIVNHRGEFYGLLLFSTIGAMFLASSSELISLYVGLELTTVPLFVLAAFFKDDKLSVEAGVKYLIVGAFSSALLLYGISFLYGLSGTTDILQMRMNLAIMSINTLDPGFVHNQLVMVIATVAILAGLGFKLGLPPFHQWVPDVYQGAPTPVAAYLSVGSKAAGLVAFIKIMILGLYAYYEPFVSPVDWGMMAGLLAVAAMILGNVMAIKQSNIKRMLAFSSIAHAGYLMIGILAMNEIGLSSVGFYMFAYLFTNMGAFAVVTLVEDKTGSCDLKNYSGLSKSSPFLAVSLTVFLLSLTGMPPLAGFFGKYYIFASAIKLASTSNSSGWLYWLVGVGLITSVFALYYYANVIRLMYFGTDDGEKISFSPPALAVVAIALAGVIILGIYPEPILQFAARIPLSFGILTP